METIASQIVDAHELPVRGMEFSPDSRVFATASGDATVKLWDTTTWKLIRRFSGTSAYTRAIAFSRCSSFLVVSELHAVVVYDYDSGETFGKWELSNLADDEHVGLIAFDDKRGEIIGVTNSESEQGGKAFIWSLNGDQVSQNDLGNFATSIWVSETSGLWIEIYDGRMDSRAYRVVRVDGSVVFEIDLRSCAAGGIPISSIDRRLVALGNRCFESPIQILSSPTGTPILSHTPQANSTPLIAISPNSRFVAISISRLRVSKSQLSVTRLIDGVEIWRTNEIGEIDALQFSPDGKFLVAISSKDRRAHFLETQSGQFKWAALALNRACRFSPDGRWFVSAGSSLSVSEIPSM
jgi:WD40 repeat protein